MDPYVVPELFPTISETEFFVDTGTPWEQRGIKSRISGKPIPEIQIFSKISFCRILPGQWGLGLLMVSEFRLPGSVT